MTKIPEKSNFGESVTQPVYHSRPAWQEPAVPGLVTSTAKIRQQVSAYMPSAPLHFCVLLLHSPGPKPRTRATRGGLCLPTSGNHQECFSETCAWSFIDPPFQVILDSVKSRHKHALTTTEWNWLDRTAALVNRRLRSRARIVQTDNIRSSGLKNILFYRPRQLSYPEIQTREMRCTPVPLFNSTKPCQRHEKTWTTKVYDFLEFWCAISRVCCRHRPHVFPICTSFSFYFIILETGFCSVS